MHGAGLSLEDFAREIAAADSISDAERKALIEQEAFLPSYMWNSMVGSAPNWDSRSQRGPRRVFPRHMTRNFIPKRFR